VAIEITLSDGRRDLFLAMDRDDATTPAAGTSVRCAELGLEADAALLWIRLTAAGQVGSLAMVGGRRAAMGKLTLQLREPGAGIELAFAGDQVEVVAGDRQQIESVTWR
jgi:hypothetical protein